MSTRTGMAARTGALEFLRAMENSANGAETDNNGIGISRYRRSVRCIAVVDTCIALYMLTIIGLKMTTLRQSEDRLLVIFGIYALQLGMAQILMSATYHNDNAIALTRCKKWYWTSLFLYMILGMELVFIFWFNGPYAIPILKIIFRGVANHIVNLYMNDLRSPFQPPPFHVSHPFAFPPLTRNSSLGGTGMVFPPRESSVPMYDPPPTYEESIKDKVFVPGVEVDLSEGPTSEAEAPSNTTVNQASDETHDDPHPVTPPTSTSTNVVSTATNQTV